MKENSQCCFKFIPLHFPQRIKEFVPYIILLNIFLGKNEVLNIVYVVYMGVFVCVCVCLYNPPFKVDMSHYGCYSFFFFSFFFYRFKDTNKTKAGIYLWKRRFFFIIACGNF